MPESGPSLVQLETVQKLIKIRRDWNSSS